MIELKPSQYASVLASLKKYFPEAIPAYNCVHIASELDLQFPPVEKIFVDKWPSAECFVLLTTICDKNELIWHLDFVHDNIEKAEKCLKDLDYQLNLRSHSFMSLVNGEKLELFDKYFRQFGVCSHASGSTLAMLTFPMEKAKAVLSQQIAAPAGFYFDILKPAEAEFVDSVWNFRKNGSLVSTFEKISLLPSVCLRTKESSVPVSFVMTHQTGVFNHAFTLPQYRGLGLSELVCRKLTQMHLDIGLQPYALVEESASSPSMKIFTAKMAWSKQSVKLCWFRFDPLGKRETDV